MELRTRAAKAARPIVRVSLMELAAIVRCEKTRAFELIEELKEAKLISEVTVTEGKGGGYELRVENAQRALQAGPQVIDGDPQ